MRELRQNLAGYIARAQKGETVVISSHGQPVAKLGPLNEAGRGTLPPELERLRGNPAYRLPLRPWRGVSASDALPVKPSTDGKTIADLLLGMRR